MLIPMNLLFSDDVHRTEKEKKHESNPSNRINCKFAKKEPNGWPRYQFQRNSVSKFSNDFLISLYTITNSSDQSNW